MHGGLEGASGVLVHTQTHWTVNGDPSLKPWSVAKETKLSTNAAFFLRQNTVESSFLKFVQKRKIVNERENCQIVKEDKEENDFI